MLGERERGKKPPGWACIYALVMYLNAIEMILVGSIVLYQNVGEKNHVYFNCIYFIIHHDSHYRCLPETPLNE